MESWPLSCQISSDSEFCKNSDQNPTVRLPGAGLNIWFILASLLPARIYDQLKCKSHVFQLSASPFNCNWHNFKWPCLWYFDKKMLCMSNFFVVCNNLSRPGRTLVLSLPLPANICLHSNIFHKWWKMQLKSGEKGEKFFKTCCFSLQIWVHSC